MALKAAALGLLSLLAASDAQAHELAVALAADDECETTSGSPTCALDLAQLRAIKKHTKPAASSSESKDVSYAHPEWLSSCKSIFMDLGSNIGVNVRKLYEPEKYHGAKLLPELEKAFGSASDRRKPDSGLCALGFEPNPEHQDRLAEIEEAYTKHGYKVHFYPYAAWRSDGFMALNTTGKREPSPTDKSSEGAHLSMRSVQWPGAKDVMVRTVDMSNFVQTLPAGSVKLMLMDIEGSEYETLAQMMQKNMLCQKTVNTALIEAHEWGEITHWGDASSFLSGVHPRSFKAVGQRVQQLIDFNWCESDKVTAIAQLDDESYSNDVDEDFGKKKAMSSLQLPTTIEKASDDAEGYEHPDWLSSCKQIFVDLGSNIGVNVRKLYEPEKYHGAKLLPELEKAFGSAADRRKPESGLCALGFEPNPAHHDRLAKLESAYSQHGYKIHFYPYAAWRSDGFMALNTTGKREPSASDKSSEGAHLSMRSVQWPGAKEIMVRTVDMANFVSTLPSGSVKLLVLDIEGSEYETLAQMMQKKVMCQGTVETALVDAHGWGEITHWGDATSFVQGVHPRSYKAVHQRIQQLLDFDWCKPGKVTAIGSMDDESYSNDVDDKFGQM
jgi:FkbM family methyltransferase